MEVNDKLFSILEVLISGHKNYPSHDSQIFQKLKIFNHRVNRKIHQLIGKLANFQEQPQDNRESPPVEQSPQFSPIREVETNDFIDPKFSPPLSRINASRNIQATRLLSECFQARTTENQKFYNNEENFKPMALTSIGRSMQQIDKTVPMTVDRIVQNVSTVRIVDKGNEILDMDMQGFLEADSEGI